MNACEAYALGFLSSVILVALIYLIRKIDKNPEAW